MATTDIRGLAAARGQMLQLNLSRMSDSVCGQTNVDPRGYMTGLNSLDIASDANVKDIKKARLLLRSVTLSNPRHGPGWVAAARLEEQVKELVEARRLIKEGCENCPQDEDVWVEAVRLQGSGGAKVVLAEAVKHVPRSVKLWLAAAELEGEEHPAAKKAVLRKALSRVPESEKLWKAAISLETPDDAKILLSRAVECVPQSIDLWLALARLESYQNAQKVLNDARKALPHEPLIWISAAKLEEVQDHKEVVHKIITRALKTLASNQVIIDRESWIKHAEDCERSGSTVTCSAIIDAVLGLGIEEADKRRTWIADADALEGRGSLHTARAVYAILLKEFDSSEAVWLKAAQFEKKNNDNTSTRIQSNDSGISTSNQPTSIDDTNTPMGEAEMSQTTRSSSSSSSPTMNLALNALLTRAVKSCPSSEILWLMHAKELWVSGHVNEARSVLTEAFAAHENSEQIWLAAVKLEWEEGEIERARNLLSKARSQAPSARVWLKSALLEREFEHSSSSIKKSSSSSSSSAEGSVSNYATRPPPSEESLLTEGLKSFHTASKLWLMLGQLYERRNNTEKARETYQLALRHCPTNIVLWLHASALEEREFGPAKARLILESARRKHPLNPELWLESVRLERRAAVAATSAANSLSESASTNTKAGVTISPIPTSFKASELLLAKALQSCPNSGILLAEDIDSALKGQQKSKSLDALKKADNDPHVVLSVARLFWKDRKFEKAQKWFDRAVLLSPDLGDAWAWFYAFLLDQGDDASRAAIEERCAKAEPAHGARWQSEAKKVGAGKRTKVDILKSVATRLYKEFTSSV